jgi:hypothetical protein
MGADLADTAHWLIEFIGTGDLLYSVSLSRTYPVRASTARKKIEKKIGDHPVIVPTARNVAS